MNEELKILYAQLLKDGALGKTPPPFEKFAAGMQDEGKAAQFHQMAVANKRPGIPTTFEEFQIEYGLKKKDQTGSEGSSVIPETTLPEGSGAAPRPEIPSGPQPKINVQEFATEGGIAPTTEIDKEVARTRENLALGAPPSQNLGFDEWIPRVDGQLGLPPKPEKTGMELVASVLPQEKEATSFELVEGIQPPEEKSPIELTKDFIYKQKSPEERKYEERKAKLQEQYPVLKLENEVENIKFNRNQAKERGLTPKQYYDSRSSFIAGEFLRPEFKGEYDLTKTIEVQEKAITDFAKNPDMYGQTDPKLQQLTLQKMYDELQFKKQSLQNYRQNASAKIDETLAQMDEQLSRLEVGGQKDGTEYQELKRERDIIAGQKEFFISPQKAMAAAVKQDSALGRINSKEQLEELYNAWYTERNQIMEQLGMEPGRWQEMQRLDQTFLPGGDPEKMKRLVELEDKLKAFAPVALINRGPITKEIATDFGGGFARGLLDVVAPATSGKPVTKEIISESMLGVLGELGAPVQADIQKVLEKAGEGPEFNTPDFWGSTLGTTAGFMGAFVGGEAMLQATQLPRLMQGIKIAAGIDDVIKASKYTKGGKFLYPTLRGIEIGAEEGLKYEAIGTLLGGSDIISEEGNFAVGALGGVLGKGTEKILGNVGSAMVGMFGKSAPRVVQATERFGRVVKVAGNINTRGLVEAMEEYGNEVGAIYNQSENWQEAKKLLEERFGTMDQNKEFFVTTYLMGIGMGTPTVLGRWNTMKAKEVYDGMSPKDKKWADEVVQAIDKDFQTPTKEAKEEGIEVTEEVEIPKLEEEEVVVEATEEPLKPETDGKVEPKGEEAQEGVLTPQPEEQGVIPPVSSSEGVVTGRVAKPISKKIAVEHAGHEGPKRITAATENTLEIEGYGTILTSQFINTLVENERLPREALKKRNIQLTEEYATKLLNDNSDLFPNEIQPEAAAIEAEQEPERVAQEAEIEPPTEEVAAVKELTTEQTRQNALVSEMKMYNDLSPAKRKTKDGSGRAMRIAEIASELGVTLKQEKSGRFVALNDKGKRIMSVSVKENVPEPKPELIDFTKEQIDAGAFTWSGQVYDPKIDLGLPWADIKKGIEDIQKGKNSVPARRVANAMQKVQEDGGYTLRTTIAGNVMEVFVPLGEPVIESLSPEQEDDYAAMYDAWFESLSDEEKEVEFEFTEYGDTETEFEQGAESAALGSDTESTETGDRQEEPAAGPSGEEIAVGDVVTHQNAVGDVMTGGTVQEILPDGRMKIKGRNKVVYTNRPEQVEKEAIDSVAVAGAGEKFYAPIGAPKPTTTGRIQPDPIYGESPKKLRETMVDLKRATGKTIYYTKGPGRRRSLGSYNPRNAAIAIRHSNDLDVTAHELGHALDDQYGILVAIPADMETAARAELMKLSKYGSKPPKGHPDPTMYKLGEGVAEYIRAFLVNPTQAEADFPVFSDWFKKAIPADMMTSIVKFGNEIRILAGATAHQQIMANVEMNPKKKEMSFLANFYNSTLNSNEEFEITWADKLSALWIDSMKPFNKAVDYATKLTGDDLLPAEDPRILARLLLGANNKFDNILKQGLMDTELNRLKDNGNDMTLDWLLDPLDKTDKATIEKEQEEVISYMIAERTIELRAKLESNVLTGIGAGVFQDIDVAVARIAEFADSPQDKQDRIKEAARRYRVYADGVLRYMVDSGRLTDSITDEDGNIIGGYQFIKKTNLHYVALQRIIEAAPDEEINMSFGGGDRPTSTKEVIKKIKGSTKTIKNPYSSLLSLAYSGIKESDRNNVLVSFRDLFMLERQMYQGDVAKLGEIARPAKSGDKNTIKVFIDGKAEYWQLQEDIYGSLTGLINQGIKLPALLTIVPRIIRATITNFPIFAIRNRIRDVQHRFIISNTRFKDVYGKKMTRKEAKDRYEKFGGGQAGYYLMNDEFYYAQMEDSIRELAQNKSVILADPKRFWIKFSSGYQNMISSGETATRTEEFKGAFVEGKRKGLDDYNASIYAAFRSRDLMDFAVAGEYMRIINQLIPFSNAAVRGLTKTVQSFEENPGGMLIRWSLYSTIPTVAMMLLAHMFDYDDEYEKLPAFQRDMFLNFKIGPDLWVSIPKPFELGILSSGIERTVSSVVFKEEKAFEGYGGSLGRGLMPIDESAIAGPLKTGVEILANKDFFRDKYIIPPHEAELLLEARNTDKSSRLGKWIQDGIGMDARNVDHAIKGVTGYFGDFGLRLSNIGREDVMAFDWSSTGLMRRSPVYNSEDVQWIMKTARKYRLNNSGPYKEFNALVGGYFEATTNKERDNAGKVAREYAANLRKEWSEEYLEEVKAELIEKNSD